MTSREQIDQLLKLDSDLLDIIKSKSNDYALQTDVLSNFKIVSQLVKLIGIDVTTPEGYCMLMVLLKIVRIWNLKQQGLTPKNESLLDSYRDLVNYTKLAFLNELEILNNVTPTTQNKP